MGNNCVYKRGVSVLTQVLGQYYPDLPLTPLPPPGHLAPSTSRGLATSPTLATAPYTEVAQVLDRIRSVSTPKVVKKVNAVFVFNVEGEGKWHVDLRTEEGGVGEGEPPAKADVTVHLSKDTFLQIFNRQLKPATAFMSGQVKFSGDMSKAMALEKVMKATREH